MATPRVFDKTRPMPRWVREHRGRRGAYWRQMWLAQPAWADPAAIRAVYHEAGRRGLVVDHAVPLNHPEVCGLHCEANLQLLTHAENQQKCNHEWPGMWREQLSWLPVPWALSHPQLEMF